MSTKDLLILILLTIVMGYVLGLMISTTVNYKLHDLIVNLPRPIIRMKNPFLKDNQNITVNIPSQNVEGETTEGFTSTIKKVSKNKKSPKKNKSKKIIEKFSSDPSDVENVSNKALIENSVYYNHKLEDKNMDAYARLFNINDKNIKNDGVKFTYSAYNQEDSDEQYIFLDNNNNKEIRASNAKKLSLIDSLKKSINKVKEIIPREKRKIDYKCKKSWHNCSSSHKKCNC
tara:strand:+ start:1550 stop:2239 length:690 start_codon:yes stop_codon:yes gene_type:complete